MKKRMIALTVCLIICTIISSVLYYFIKADLLLTLAVSFGTTAYHLFMRLGVGLVFNLTVNNRADYTQKWYRNRKFEKKLYELLKVKRWKKYMPTFDNSQFDSRKHSWSEIAQAMCQAELVHETIVLLSFVPILFSRWLGAGMVFVITSIIAALFDAAFVIMQRYNRPRITAMMERKEENNGKQI